MDGDFRVRFVTSYPTDITDELIEVVKNSDKISGALIVSSTSTVLVKENA